MTISEMFEIGDIVYHLTNKKILWVIVGININQDKSKYQNLKCRSVSKKGKVRYEFFDNTEVTKLKEE
jgi:hypothetical protein